MPNVIAADRQRLTYLEDLAIAEWMDRVAMERGTDRAVILREATSAYHLLHAKPGAAPNHSELRRAAKVAARSRTHRLIASGKLTPAGAQQQAAPIDGPVRIVNLWPAIRRHARAHP